MVWVRQECSNVNPRTIKRNFLIFSPVSVVPTCLAHSTFMDVLGVHSLTGAAPGGWALRLLLNFLVPEG